MKKEIYSKILNEKFYIDENYNAIFEKCKYTKREMELIKNSEKEIICLTHKIKCEFNGQVGLLLNNNILWGEL